ncbi:MAG: hypothetical protein ACTTH7_03500 [Treponema sp.]
MIPIKKILHNSVLVLLFFLIAACTNKASIPEEIDVLPSKKIFDHKLLLILGKQFADSSYAFTHLYTVYDSASIEKNVHIVSYSEMISKNKQPRVKMISEMIDAYTIDLIISFGLPEGSAKHLTAAKNSNPHLQIYTLLPDEETLPLEVCSAAVIDFVSSDSLLEESTHTVSSDTIKILTLASVFAAEIHKENQAASPIEQLTIALNTVRAELTKSGCPVPDFVIQPHIDTEFNIASYNYLVLSEIQTLAAAAEGGV